MVFFPVTAQEAAGGRDAGDIPGKLRQVAQVLEGLGIAFTHHRGLTVPVKHPDQLPGIAESLVFRGFAVVVGGAADGFHVSAQLFLIRGVAVLFHDIGGVENGGFHQFRMRGIVDIDGIFGHGF